MFGDGWTEILIIVVVAVVVIGPKDLPRVLRTVGKWTGTLRRTAAQFQGQFQEALREAEREADLADARKLYEDLKSVNPLNATTSSIKEELAKVDEASEKLRRELAETIRPAAPAGETAPVEPVAITEVSEGPLLLQPEPPTPEPHTPEPHTVEAPKTEPQHGTAGEEPAKSA